MTTELLDYSQYIEKIMSLDASMKLIGKQIGIKRGLNSNFVKAVVRYMITNNGYNNNIGIDTLIDKLNLDTLMSPDELKECLIDIKREEVLQLLKDEFGIILTNDQKTITFRENEGLQHSYLPILN